MSTPAHPDFSELLSAQEPFLRRLARGLIANAVDRDEAVQETLLAAWQSRDRSASRRVDTESLQELGPERVQFWLSTVLRRRAGMLHRRRRPHEALEPESVIDESHSSPEAISLRAERQSLLAQAIMKLPEASRDAIILKYQDGMTVAHIAERRGLPESTVRSHLRRGQAELRRILETTSDAQDRADGAQPWLLALMPLAFPSGAPPELAVRLGSSAAVTATGGLAVNSPLIASLVSLTLMKKLIVLAGLLAVTGICLKSLGAEPLSAPPTSAVAPIAADPVDQLAVVEPVDVGPAPTREVLAQAEALSPEAAVPEVSSQVEAPRSEYTITGRVLLVDAHPVPDTEVTASLDAKPGSPTYGKAVTGADGTFTLDLIGDDVPEQVMLSVDVSRFKWEGARIADVARDAIDMEIRLDALLVRLTAPEVTSTTPSQGSGALVIQVPDRTFDYRNGVFLRFDKDRENSVTQLLPAGPAYSFCLSYGDYMDDDLVAYLQAGVPSGLHELSLSSDTPELGSFTVSLTGAALPADSKTRLRVSLEGDGVRGGSLYVREGRTGARKSGEFPGRYEVKAEVSGDAPRGWVIPKVVEPMIEIRADGDTQVEVRLDFGGMIRLTVATSSTAAYERGDELDEFWVMYRRVGAAKWRLARLRSPAEDGTLSVTPFPLADEPVLIDDLLQAGSYEVKLLGDTEDVGPVPVIVSERKFCDVTIELL